MHLLDRAYVRLSRPLGCFHDGWGPLPPGDDFLESDARERELEEPALRWTRTWLSGEQRVTEAEHESPDPDLPLECRRVRVRRIEPRAKPSHAVALALGAWGDEGFEMRRRMLTPVVRSGVTVLLPETPYYGARRRIGQRGARLREVMDLALMGRATVREARGLLGWARRQGFEKVGVVGYSMGGQMAAMTGASMPWPVHVVAMAAPVSPASVFLDGPLRRDVRFDRLGAGGEARLREVLGALDVLSLPPPVAPELAAVVGTRRDAIVPPADVWAIARHWGVHPRWLDDGHVSAVVFRAGALAQAVIDNFARRPMG